MLVLASFITALAIAQPAPEQIKAVWDYHLKGQGKGPILVDAILCKTVEQKAADTKFECAEPLGESVPKDTLVNVWLAFLLPKGDAVESVVVQAVLDGQVRETKDLKLKGETIRTRTWTAFSLRKAGNWEFRVMDKDKVLKTLSIKSS